MPLIIPPGFAQAVVECSLTGDSEPMVNTFGVNLPSAITPTELADGIFGYWKEEFDTVIANGYTLQAVDVYVGQDGGPNLVFSSTESPQAFAGTGNPLPQNCAALIRKRTDLAGRRGRGRLYVPGVTETEVSGIGVIAGTYLNTWQTAANAFLGDLVSLDAQMHVLHRSEGAGVEPVPTPVVALVVDDLIATQRQRLRR